VNCPRCRAENREGRRFCGECGLSFASSCPSCGFLNEGGEKFCGGCGRSLTATASPVEPRFTSPEAYTPKHLAERILTSKAALEGERKQVTVLFADLKGSMELLADRDPEEARKILDPVLERMMEAVHRYEGTVNQVMGDGIMALFGAPLAHEDHAVRACYAALRMQESIKGYAEELFQSQGAPIQIRVGLNSGEVVVRAIGTDLHMDYTAVGQTTHLAARMEQLASPGSILISSDVLRLAEGYVEVKSRGAVPVKGLGEPVHVYEVVGAGIVRSRLQAAAVRGFSRFVGRHGEVEQLRKALEQARDAHGQVVAVVGEPGVGKSRLFHEFTHSPRIHDWLILESGSVSYGKATAYLPVIELLRGYFQIEPRDDVRKVREKITGKLLALDRTLEPTLPAFLALLDVPVEDPLWRGLDPVQRRQQTLGAVKRLLLRESQLQPLLLVFEDLHWIDSETQAILDGLVESLPTARILALFNYRPEYRHGWGNRTYYTQLRIDPLPSAGAEELLASLLGTDESLRPLKQLLVERTEGNPFFLEESVRTLVETRVLEGEQGAYRATRDVRTIQVASTVQTMLAARIDRLKPDEKRLLQAASVIGKDVPFALLRAVAECNEADLRRLLTSLQSAEFLYEMRLFPDLEYTFKHALTHETTYGSMLHERRRSLHASTAVAIEQLHADRLVEYAESLAHHAFRGEGWDKAVQYGRQAGTKALTRSANREATAYFRQALEALPRLPESPRTKQLAIDLRLDLYHALLPLDELRALLSDLRQAEMLAMALEDEERLAWSRRHLCHVLILIDDIRESVRLAHDVVGRAKTLGSWRIEADASVWLGCGYYALGQHRRAVDALRRGVAVRQAHSESQHVIAQSGYVAMFLAELGEFADAETAAEITTRSPLVAEDRPWSLMNTCWQIAWFWCLKGDLHRAAHPAERAVQLCEQWNFRRTLGMALAVLGHARALAGRTSEAADLVEQGVRHADTFGMTWLRCQRSVYLGEAYLLAGRPGDASRTADYALSLARERGERGSEAWALRLQGEIAAATTPGGGVSENRYREALTLGIELEMRPLVAHCHLGLGKLYRRTGKREQA
jgi:class 3 adenylate cyclase/tetratricopeptide (TPR) repeat protein